MKRTSSVAGNTLIPILGIVLLLSGCKRDLGSAGNEKGKLATGAYTVLTTQRPTTADSDTPVELGMKFRSTISGTITKPLAVPVTNMAVTGNRWKWSTDASDKDYTNAVYRNTGQSIPNYKANGNSWSNNRWADGPYADSFLLPDNSTSGSDY